MRRCRSSCAGGEQQDQGKGVLRLRGQVCGGVCASHPFSAPACWTAFHRAEDVLSWTSFRRMDRQVWHPLLNQLEQDYGADGFDKPFFVRLFQGEGASKSENWERLVRDWKDCIERQTLGKLKNFIAIRQNNFESGLIKMMDQVTRNIKAKGIPRAEPYRLGN